MDSFYSVPTNKIYTSEIEINKSRFLGFAKYADTVQSAQNFVQQIREKFRDARHVVYAYVVDGMQKSSDDGEPSGTAGKPMLEVLVGQGLYNTVAVVTRYFGGTLLGTGGLVRAYSKAVQEGLANSVVIEKILSSRMEIYTDYNGIGKIQYIIGKSPAITVKTEYTDKVSVEILIKKELSESIYKEIVEATNGKAEIVRGDDCWCGEADGEVIIF